MTEPVTEWKLESARSAREMALLDPEEWDWDYCLLCATPRVRCKDCKNSSCNGGGCDECTELFTAAIRLCSNSSDSKVSWFADMEARTKQEALDYACKVIDDPEASALTKSFLRKFLSLPANKLPDDP